MEDRVGKDELTRIDAQDIGKQARGFGLGKPETPVEISIQASASKASPLARMRVSAIR